MANLSPTDRALKDFLKAGGKENLDASFHDISCPICSNSTLLMSEYPDRRSLFFANMTVLSCTYCGLSFVPTPPKAIGYYYRKLYSLDKGRRVDPEPETMFDGGYDRELAVARSEFHVSIAREFVPKIGTCVDIGAGYGATLRASSAKRKIAVELDEGMQRYLDFVGAKRVDRISSIGDEVADVVISSHYLEHLYIGDILHEIREMLRVLRPGGVAIVEVPNACLLRFGVHHVRHSPHLVFFSAHSLKMLAERAGAGLVQMRWRGKEPRPLVNDPLYYPSPELDERHGSIVAVMQK